MDSSLSALKACRHLALSTNNLDKIGNLAGLESLETLSLGRNCLKKLENLDGVAGTLQQLWVSYNQIDRLVGALQSSQLACMRLQPAWRWRLHPASRSVLSLSVCERRRRTPPPEPKPAVLHPFRRASKSAASCARCTPPTTASRTGPSWTG